MSTIQQLKNFIRHGKQARAANNNTTNNGTANHDEPRKTDASSLQQAPRRSSDKPTPASESIHGKQHGNKEFSVTYAQAPPDEQNPVSPNIDQSRNRVPKNRRIDEANLVKLVAEENANKSKFPRYPGLERWELLEKMGDGAFSNVYRARDLQGDRGQVAIKVVRKYEMNSMQGNKHLHPDFKRPPRAAERSNILKEVQIMRQLDHPNIVKLIEFSESRQYYYIVLELAPGGELFHQIVRLTYFSEELSRHVIVRVARALEYLHEEKGVVHRDIKPENILFTPIPFVPSKHPKPKQPGDEDKVDEGDFVPGVGAGGIGDIKIADFGLSKIVWETQTMTPCGTVGYTAPEIVKDERYSKSVDMWALGCVLYTLLCGFPPFYDESLEVLTKKVAEGNYTFLSPWWDDISIGAKDLISHLLTVDPTKRYTIKEFLSHPWITEGGLSPRDERRSEPSSRPPFSSARFDETPGRRHDFRSPAAINLREVFDVSYAVHRQEEEGKIRAALGVRAGGAGRPLGGLDEEDEEEEEEEERGEKEEVVVEEEEEEEDGMDVDRDQESSLEESMQRASIRDQEQQQARGRERNRVSERENNKGYGQHSAAVTAAARQQVRERNRQKGAFELNLDNATLLGKRGKKVPVAGA